MMITRRSLLAVASVAMLPALFAQTTAPADVSGKWHFTFDTEGGPREFDADFKVSGTAVTGIWDKKPDVKGAFEDGKLNLEFPVNSEEAGEGILKLTGKLTDVLTGTWSFQTYSGSFKAVRPKSS